jgi:hypothetical protein
VAIVYYLSPFVFIDVMGSGRKSWSVWTDCWNVGRKIEGEEGALSLVLGRPPTWIKPLLKPGLAPCLADSLGLWALQLKQNKSPTPLQERNCIALAGTTNSQQTHAVRKR